MIGKCILCGKTFSARPRGQRFCSTRCANRANLNNKNYPMLPKQFSASLAELFGVLLGDGSVMEYYVRIYLNGIADKGYPQRLVSLIKEIFPDVTVTTKKRPARGTEEVQISSKDVCDYMRKIGFRPKERTVPFWIRRNKIFTQATIRGLFDTEGSVGTKKFEGKRGTYTYHQLTFTNKNKNLLRFMEDTLHRFGYKPTKNSQKNIYISNKGDIERYSRIIGTRNPKLEKKLKMYRITGCY